MSGGAGAGGAPISVPLWVLLGVGAVAAAAIVVFDVIAGINLVIQLVDQGSADWVRVVGALGLAAVTPAATGLLCLVGWRTGWSRARTIALADVVGIVLGAIAFVALLALGFASVNWNLTF